MPVPKYLNKPTKKTPFKKCLSYACAPDKLYTPF